MIFLRIYIDFTSLLFFENKRKRNETSHRGPWKDLGACHRVPGRRQNRGGGGRPAPSDGGCRRGGRGGETARGGHALPLGGLDWGWGRPEGARRRAVAEAAVADSSGAAPAALGGGKRPGELRGGERDLAAGTIGAGERRGRRAPWRQGRRRGGLAPASSDGRSVQRRGR